MIEKEFIGQQEILFLSRMFWDRTYFNQKNNYRKEWFLCIHIDIEINVKREE